MIIKKILASDIAIFFIFFQMTKPTRDLKKMVNRLSLLWQQKKQKVQISSCIFFVVFFISADMFEGARKSARMNALYWYNQNWWKQFHIKLLILELP